MFFNICIIIIGIERSSRCAVFEGQRAGGTIEDSVTLLSVSGREGEQSEQKDKKTFLPVRKHVVK